MRTIANIEGTDLSGVISFDARLPTHDEVICTLYEGDFHYGVAALANSLVSNGFRGLIWVGYRGELPAWTKKLQTRSDGLFEVGGATLAFEKSAVEMHFTQFKPEFMATLFRRGIARKRLWYFDPDITVRCSWNFFERWSGFGIALCEDITMGTMPSTHPIRCVWRQVARAAGWGDPVREQDRYYNAGFIGVNRDFLGFLTTWQSAIDLARSHGAGANVLKDGPRDFAFNTPDQDALNIAAMYSDAPLSAIGPEGMGFIPGGFTMYHSPGQIKSWRKKFLLHTLSGVPPSNADKHYLQNVQGPICPYSPVRLRSLRMGAAISAAIGRFYHKGQ